MQTLLIAEGAQEMAAGITQFLQGEFQVSTCHDGETAVELLQELKPQILILNLMLPFKDGLTVLQESVYRPAAILALTHFVNPYIADRALELGVGALLLTPTPKTVAVRLLDLLSGHIHEPEKASTTQARVALQLTMLHFASARDGYRQLCAGIPMFHTDPQQNLSKELYPAIAQVCGCKTEKCVEHSIRLAIEDAWKRGDRRVWTGLFPSATRCPTNKVFIARIAQLLDE